MTERVLAVGQSAEGARMRELGDVFCPDPQLDRQLRGRTLAVVRDIRQIYSDTSNAEAFQKYVLDYLDRTMRDCELPPGEAFA